MTNHAADSEIGSPQKSILEPMRLTSPTRQPGSYISDHKKCWQSSYPQTVLTTASCVIQENDDPQKFLRGSIEDSKIEIQSLPDEEKSLMRSKNYSKKYHTRWLKDTDSSVAWQTGLLKVEGTVKN